MQCVIVKAFGGIEQLELVEQPDPTPRCGQVLVRLTSIGMNHAELMQRRGAYRLTSGDPPFTPGLEGGGVIEAIGPDVTDRHVGQRVILSLTSPNRDAAPGSAPMRGTYRSHYLTDASHTVIAPDCLPDEQLGALWLAYMTSWGALVRQQNVREGQMVVLPAASSSVAIAASQVCRTVGCITIGTTTSADKIDKLHAMPEAMYDHIVCTRDDDWPKAIKKLTDGRGVDVFFDPVAAGEFLNQEIRLLAKGGTIWVYGLLGAVGPVDVTPLIRKQAAIRGYINGMLVDAGEATLAAGYRHVLEHIGTGHYRLPVAETFRLCDVQRAHKAMEASTHIGKLILIP